MSVCRRLNCKRNLLWGEVVKQAEWWCTVRCGSQREIRDTSSAWQSVVQSRSSQWSAAIVTAIKPASEALRNKDHLQ